MELNDFTLAIAFLAFPGIVAYFVLNSIAPKVKNTGFDIFLKIFSYSIASYLLFWLVKWLWISDVLIPLVDGNACHIKLDLITIGDIFGASVSAILLSFFLSFALRYRWLNRFSKWIYSSNRSGNEDVWSDYHNLPDSQKNKGWVYVRVHDRGIIYFGGIVGWSDGDGESVEMIISDAQVFLDDGKNDKLEPLYEVDKVYICSQKTNISIEVPKQEEKNDTIQ